LEQGKFAWQGNTVVLALATHASLKLDTVC
jgi:hypothetical protein